MKIGEYELYQYRLPLMDSNMFVLTSEKSALIIDPNEDEAALDKLKSFDLSDITIILTHEHFDHISGVNAVRKLVQNDDACKVIASSECAQKIPDPNENLSKFFLAMFIMRSSEERLLASEIFDEDYGCKADVSFESEYRFSWHDLNFKLLGTPGHSAGSICVEIYDDSGKLLAVATGDSLVQGNKVITRLPGGDKKMYREQTLPYLMSLAPDTLILPGHGDVSYLKELELG